MPYQGNKLFVKDVFIIYTIEQMTEILKGRNFTICDETQEVKNCKQTFICLDQDGFYIKTNIDKIVNRPNTNFARFSVGNPHSIDNINLVGERKGYKSKCVDSNFDCKRQLEFVCGCGKPFKTVYTNYLMGHKIRCHACSKYTKALSFDEIKANLKGRGFNLLISESDYHGVTKTPLTCCDDDGYKYDVVYNRIMEGKCCETFHRCNPYSLENIKLYLKNNDMPFECISSEFISCQDIMEFRCLRCGETIKQNWRSINRTFSDNHKGRLCCPNCDYTFESTHASALKQVFLHEYPDTIVEDRSFINPLTNYVMPTDIVNHRLKIAIEVQSQWHDFPDKIERDKMKRDYWISRGYSFYAPDIRNYTILEMCQLFFNLEELPDYLDYALNKRINLKEIQKQLNSGKAILEIASEMNLSAHRIYDALYDGRLFYPEGYQNNWFVSVNQYDDDGNLLNTFHSIAQAARANNIKEKTLTSAISKGARCGGFVWKRCRDDVVKNA